MAIAFDRAGIEGLRARLGAYARGCLDRSGELALQIHADDVGAEHLLATLMDDAECAAHRVVLHAFADPETIADEARALASGILISGSTASLPFSPLGVRALRAARALAAARRDVEVGLAHVLLASFDELEPDLRGTFEDSGWSRTGVEGLLAEGLLASVEPGRPAVAESGHLFQAFSDDAKRVLSSAARLARAAPASSISAAHLFQACLQSETALERAAGMPASRARIALRGRSADDSRVEGRPLAVDEVLERLLAGLGAGADTLEVLAGFHRGETPELARILARHKVTEALVARTRGAFRDPDVPSRPEGD
jgi:ATP-dependent Clp protease ATP-binding subunit ClpA